MSQIQIQRNAVNTSASQPQSLPSVGQNPAETATSNSLLGMINEDARYLLRESQSTLQNNSNTRLLGLAADSLYGLASKVGHHLRQHDTQMEIVKMMSLGFVAATAGKVLGGVFLRRCGLQVLERIAVRDAFQMLARRPAEALLRVTAGGISMGVNATIFNALSDGLDVLRGRQPEQHFALRTLASGSDFSLMHIANSALHDYTSLSLRAGLFSFAARAVLNLICGTLILNTASVIRADLFNHLGLSHENLENYFAADSFSRSMALHVGNTAAAEVLRGSSFATGAEAKVQLHHLYRRAEVHIRRVFNRLSLECAPVGLGLLTSGTLAVGIRAKSYGRVQIETHATPVAEYLLRESHLDKQRDLEVLLEDWVRTARSENRDLRNLEEVQSRAENLGRILESLKRVELQEKRNFVAQILFKLLTQKKALEESKVQKQFVALETYLARKNNVFNLAEVKAYEALGLKSLVGLHLSFEAEVNESIERLEALEGDVTVQEEVEEVVLDATPEGDAVAELEAQTFVNPDIVEINKLREEVEVLETDAHIEFSERVESLVVRIVEDMHFSAEMMSGYFLRVKNLLHSLLGTNSQVQKVDIRRAKALLDNLERDVFDHTILLNEEARAQAQQNNTSEFIGRVYRTIPFEQDIAIKGALKGLATIIRNTSYAPLRAGWAAVVALSKNIFRELCDPSGYVSEMHMVDRLNEVLEILQNLKDPSADNFHLPSVIESRLRALRRQWRGVPVTARRTRNAEAALARPVTIDPRISDQSVAEVVINREAPLVPDAEAPIDIIPEEITTRERVVPEVAPPTERIEIRRPASIPPPNNFFSIPTCLSDAASKNLQALARVLQAEADRRNGSGEEHFRTSIESGINLINKITELAKTDELPRSQVNYLIWRLKDIWTARALREGGQSVKMLEDCLQIMRDNLDCLEELDAESYYFDTINYLFSQLCFVSGVQSRARSEIFSSFKSLTSFAMRNVHQTAVAELLAFIEARLESIISDRTRQDDNHNRIVGLNNEIAQRIPLMRN